MKWRRFALLWSQCRPQTVGNTVEFTASAPMREAWLHGWTRRGSGVVIGGTIHCAGCGRSVGTTRLPITVPAGAWQDEPEWPFDEATCPLCDALSRERIIHPPRGAERLPA